MYLSYSLKGSDVKTTVRVPFDPPLLGYEEVKPRLMSMKVDAEVDLGMVSLRCPHVFISLTVCG